MLRARQRRAEGPLPPDFEDEAPRAEEFTDLNSALARLPEDDRLPLLLYYYDGKDTATLATELGLSQGGVCVKLYRARRKLRALLQEEVTAHE
jgi:RNA polymerase sigma-70 factor (ECF subfamily)